MRWLKISGFIALVLVGIYTVAMLFAPENTKTVLTREVPYPVEKVYPQFAILEHFTSWNEYFSAQKNFNIEYFTPYEGQGSALSFNDGKNKEKSGELYIRYAVPMKALRYNLYEHGQEMPYKIDVQFKSNGVGKTMTTWTVETPKRPLMWRGFNFFSQKSFNEDIDRSIANLTAIMGNKVDREGQMAHLKFDSIMVEKLPAQTLLGISVSTSNKKDLVFRSVVLSHNKVRNFVKMDLGKKDDEFGFPVMISDPNNLKAKDFSYFYGIPLSKKVGLSDNNFSFRGQNASEAYVIYYKGNFAGRTRSIQQLLSKAQKDAMRTGDLQEIFMDDPAENKDVVMKIALPVFH